MKKLRSKLQNMPQDYLDGLFHQDDVTKGVLRKGLRLRVNNIELQKKLNNALLRSLISGCLDFRNHPDRAKVDQIILRLRELDLYHPETSPQSSLIHIKTLLETEAKPVASPMLCFKKIGELHQNLHQKIFLVDNLNFLRKYWSQEMLIAVDLFADSLIEFHQELKLKTEQGEKIELYIEVLQDLIMQSQAGNEYFTLNTKLHNKHLLLASEYNTLDQEKLENGLKLITSESFFKILVSCEHLIKKLKKEKVSEAVDPDLIKKIGWAVGKTTMIDSYSKVVSETLANLGTFVSNTLHVLIGQILVNLHKDSPYRNGLIEAYKTSEETMGRI